MGKRALVTGGSRGIGASCVRALARDGFDVVINYLNSEKKAFALAEETGGQAIKADVSDAVAVKDMFQKAGPVDVLVCSAGIGFRGLFTETLPEQWRKVFSVNVDGAYNACFAALPYMIHQHWGRIVLISSMWGRWGASCEVAYSASKAAMIGMGKALAKEVGPSGITVNCVAPGVIDTDMNRDLAEEDMEQLADSASLMRLGTPEDVAETVSFLASERASFITGQTIGVDGGFIG